MKKTKFKYDGWTNRATWRVILWLDYDKENLEYWQETAARLRNDADDSRWVWDEGYSVEDVVTWELTQTLEEEIRMASPLHGPSMYADLLNEVLGEVNWREVAQHCLNELENRRPASLRGVI